MPIGFYHVFISSVMFDETPHHVQCEYSLKVFRQRLKMGVTLAVVL